jgi:hypothetical protein
MLVLCPDRRPGRRQWSVPADILILPRDSRHQDHLLPIICHPASTKGTKTPISHLDIVSYSAAVKPASEKRIRPFSELFGTFARRFPVLRFFGMARSGGGGDWLRPLSVSAGVVSTPGQKRMAMLVEEGNT